MGSTKYDYSALLSDGELVHADNEDELNKKIQGKDVVVSYHRKEDDLRCDRDEIIIDQQGDIAGINTTNLPSDVLLRIKK